MTHTANLSTREILALTLYGEARGDIKLYGLAPLVAICHVIRNRFNSAAWFGESIREVCLKPYQFSCWNVDDPNRKLLTAPLTLSDHVFKQCLSVADQFLTSPGIDITFGSTHYHASYISPPTWASKHTLKCRIGSHLFYKP